MKRSLGVLVALAASGCAVQQRAAVANKAQTQMVGMSKTELLSCAGVPVRQAQADDLEFFTYTGGGDSTSVAYGGTTSRRTTYAFGKRMQRYCEVTFVLRAGVVERVNYNGRTGGALSRGEQCAFVVENCVR
jgi:hypothetical protein